MDPALLVAFVAVAAILTVAPGADMAIVAHTTLTRGRRAAFLTTLGVCSGLAVHAVASSVGLSSLLARSATAYAIVKTLGACYLIVLGILALRASWRKDAPEAVAVVAKPQSNAYLQGLVSNVLNPKVALFYLTFLPQFVEPQHVLAQSLALAAIHIAMGLLWLTLFARIIERAGAAFGAGSLRRWLQRATGGALVLLGARLLAERAPDAT